VSLCLHQPQEPLLGSFIQNAILKHKSLEAVVAINLADRLGTPAVPASTLQATIMDFYGVSGGHWSTRPSQ
jgi:hypothetical protein